MTSSVELAARLSSVVSVQQDILSAINDPEKVMDLVVTRTPELTNGTGAVIEMAEGNELVYRAASGAAAAHVGLRLERDSSISGACVRERRTIRSDDVENDSRANAVAALAMGMRSLIVTPLVQGNAVIGVLKTFSAKRNAFEDLDSYTLQLLAGMTSAALMQSHEFREHQAAETRYRMLFEKNVAGVFRTTLDGRFLDCNDALAAYLGYASRDELLSLKVWDIYHQRADRDQFLSMLRRDRALTNLRLHLKKKDGSEVTGVVNASIIPDEEGEPQVLGTLVEDS